jgi:NodT family efflux transporter outer membrane factor (OMF) lipoprotein
MRRPERLTLLAAATIALAGCRVGPKYAKPAAPVPLVYKEPAPTAYRSALPGTWQPANPSETLPKGRWWEIFHEPELNALEEQLNIDNQTIAQFFQNFMAAREQVRQARSSYYPTVSVSPSVNTAGTGGGQGAFITTGGISAGTPGTPGAGTGTGTSTGTTPATTTTRSGGGGISVFNSFALPFDVSWQPDLWGRVRNTVSEFRYAAQVSAADLENQRLAEQASLAVFYFELRGQDSLQDLYNRTIAAYVEMVQLTRVRVETGIDSPESLAQAEVTLRDAQAAGIGIATNRAIYEHAIATLIGQPASNFSLPVRPLATPVPSIPVGLPSELLQRRPDIAAAERTMAQANAAIGVATSAYYPTVNLTAAGGLQTSTISTLFSVPSLFWSLGASAAQTIFDAGLRHATVAQFKANYEADVAAYRQTVLTAFQQVEDYIATLRVTSEQISAQREAVAAALRNLEISVARYETGLDPYLNVITAQTTLFNDQQTLTTLRVAEMVAAVQLVQALGGGWDVAQLPTPTEVTSRTAADRLAPGAAPDRK